MNKILISCLVFIVLATAAFGIIGEISYQTVDVIEGPPATSTSNIMTSRYPSQNMDTYSGEDDTQSVKGNTVSITQPSWPMTLQLTLRDSSLDANTGALRGNIFIAGRSAQGEAIAEIVTLVSGDATSTFFSVETYQAFSRVDMISYDNDFANSVSVNDTIGIGTSDKVGLSNAIDDWDQVYKIVQVSKNVGTTQLFTLSSVSVTSKNINPSGDVYFGGRNYSISVFKPATLSGAGVTPSYYIYSKHKIK